jgi:hypothetical protein
MANNSKEGRGSQRAVVPVVMMMMVMMINTLSKSETALGIKQ